MSCAIVYSCATCSKTVKGKQDYAICVKCSKRVHRKCYDDYLSDSSWTRICQSFNCTACGAGSRGQNFNSNYFTDSERQLVIEESMEKTCMCQHTLHQQLLNTKLWLVHLERVVILSVTDVVTRIGFIETIQNLEFGGALFVVASNFYIVMPLSIKLKGLELIFFVLIHKKILLWIQAKRIVTLRNDSLRFVNRVLLTVEHR